MTSPAVQPKTLPTGRTLPRPRRSRSKPRRKLNWARFDVRSRHCFLVLLFLVAQGLFFSSRLFQVQDMHIAGLETLKAGQVKAQSGIKSGDVMWMTHPTTVAQRLLQLQNVQRAHVQYVLPGKVRITIQERQPVYQVAGISPAEANNTRSGVRPVWYAVDQYGLVLRPIKGTNNELPRVRLEQPVQVGQRLHPALIETCAQACQKIDRQFPAAVWYYNLDQRGNLSFRTFSRQYPVDVQVGTLDNLEHKLAVLKALMETVLQKQRVTAIDLRYPAPVVRLLHPPKPAPAEEVVPAE